MVVLFECDFIDCVKMKELEMGDLCGASYGSFTAEELDARVKKVLFVSCVEFFMFIFIMSEMLRCFDIFECVNV